MDQLSVSWSSKNKLLYAFPSSSLIPLVLELIHHPNTLMILITPWYHGTMAVRADQIVSTATPQFERGRSITWMVSFDQPENRHLKYNTQSSGDSGLHGVAPLP